MRMCCAHEEHLVGQFSNFQREASRLLELLEDVTPQVSGDLLNWQWQHLFARFRSGPVQSAVAFLDV